MALTSNNILEQFSGQTITYPGDLYSGDISESYNQMNSYILFIPKQWNTDEDATPKNPTGKLAVNSKQSIALYMPNDISIEHNLNWNTEEVGIAGATGVSSMSDFMSALGGRDRKSVV